MAKKDLLSRIDGIEVSEDAVSRYEGKIEKLTILVGKQKKIIAEQTNILEEQKQKLAKEGNLPDDVRELRGIIGTQRAQLREFEEALESAKGDAVQAKTELEAYLSRKNPQQLKLEGAIETIGSIKAELAQKTTELTLKNETLRALANRLKETSTKAGQAKGYEDQIGDLKADLAQKTTELTIKEDTINSLTNRLKESDALANTLQDKFENLNEGISKQEYEDLKIKHSEDRQKLKSEYSKLESKVLEQKIQFQEKISEAKDMEEKYQNFVKKMEGITNKNDELKQKIKTQEANMEDLKKFKADNANTVGYLSKLQPIMEEDPIFRAFFIIQEVGSITFDDLKKAVGAPAVIIKREVQKLQQMGIIEMDDSGKITPKQFGSSEKTSPEEKEGVNS